MLDVWLKCSTPVSPVGILLLTLPNHIHENIEIFCVLVMPTIFKQADDELYGNSYFRDKIRVSLIKRIIFVGMKKASKRNLHLLKRDMPMNESYHISSFRSLLEFTDKLPVLWHVLNCKLPKRGRKLLAWRLYFNTWTLCFCKERSVFWHVSASCLRNVYCLNLALDPCQKNDISGYIWPIKR